MSIDITPVIEALIALIAALVAGRLLPWLRERLGAERMAQLEAAYNVAVYAAEEIYRAGHGEQKLEYACAYLEARGFEVDLDRLRATVNQMRDAKQALPAGGTAQSDVTQADGVVCFSRQLWRWAGMLHASRPQFTGKVLRILPA